MPLYKRIDANDFTTVVIWKIKESLEEISSGVKLTERCQNRVNSMRSEIHQKGFYSVRQL